MLPLDTETRVRALLTLYRESHYDVELPRGGSATLRVDRAPPPAIVRWLGSERFAAYLTACNPRSRSLPEAENERRLEALRAELRERRRRFLEGAGHVPGATWREPSLLVCGLDVAEIDALLVKHEQNCIVTVRPGEPCRLRVYRPDWRGMLGEAPDVEWPSPS